MFLEKDERLIILDFSPNPDIWGFVGESLQPTISISEFQKLEDVGVKTITLENLDFNKPGWEQKIDNILENTGLKILLPFWFQPPPGSNWFTGKKIDYAKPGWFVGAEINYADPDVGKEIDEYTLKILDQLSYTKGRTQLTYAYATGGEFVWFKTENWGEHGQYENEMLAEFVVERQKILSSQYKEVWMQVHDAMGGTLHTMLVVNNTLYAAFPECKHYRINHLYFPWFPYLHKDNPPLIPLRRIPWAKYFVGSQYVGGLSTNFDEGMEHGVWGFITAPLHIEIGEIHISDEMLENIRVAIDKLSLQPDYSGAWKERPLGLE